MRGILKKATRLYGAGKYPEVIRLLEPQVFRFRESYNYYYILGMSCLRTGDFGGAHSYLKRCLHFEEKEVKPLLALAIVHLKRLENDKALLLWLQALDVDKHNTHATKGLKFLKKNPDPTEIEYLFESGKFKKFLPSEIKFARFFPAIATILGLMVLGLLSVLGYNYYQDWKGSIRNDLSIIELDPDKRIFDDSGTYKYILSDKEIRKIFEKAQELLLHFKDNRARVEINRLLNSNASAYVKQQAEKLNTAVREPDFATFTDSFEYETVLEDPVLYNGCYVRWKGKSGNVRIGEDRIRFDFLVGYHDEKVLLGVVPVYLEFAAKIIEQFPIELLAQIIISEEPEYSNKPFVLRGISIHQLGPVNK